MNTEPIIVHGTDEAENKELQGRFCDAFTEQDLLLWFKKRPDSLWIALDPEQLLRQLTSLPAGFRRASRLLLLSAVSASRAAVLRAYFETVVSPEESVTFVSHEVLAEVLLEETPSDYFIGGRYVAEDDVLLLYRGDLSAVIVPSSWFQRDTKSIPDPADFEVTDFGQTVRLGQYEAAADAILYNFDSEYRRRAKKRQIESDDSLGGSLRRLRLERGVTQDDFPGLSARTIRRIEKGEISHPQPDTLRKIALRLKVKLDEIRSW